MSNATPLTKRQRARSREAAERLEVAYLWNAFINLVELLDGRAALLRDLAAESDLDEQDLEWSDLVEAWEHHKTETHAPVVAEAHRLIERALGV